MDLEELTQRDWNILLTNSTQAKYKKNNVVFEQGKFNY